MALQSFVKFTNIEFHHDAIQQFLSYFMTIDDGWTEHT